MAERYPQQFMSLRRMDEQPDLLERIEQNFQFVNEHRRWNVYQILANLFIQPAIAVSRSRDWYRDHQLHPSLTHTYAVDAQDELSHRKLVKKVTGSNFKKSATVLSAGNCLDAFCGDIIVQSPHVREGAIYTGKTEWEGVGSFGVFSEKELLSAWEGLFTINEQLQDVQLGWDPNHIFESNYGTPFKESKGNVYPKAGFMPLKVQLSRKFGEKGGGRFYQLDVGGVSYQMQKQIVRQYFNLNGEPVVEPDFEASNVYIAYAMGGKNLREEMSDDPYLAVCDQLGLDEDYRDAVKHHFIVAIHAGTRARYLQGVHGTREFWDLHRAEVGKTEVYDAIMQVHPILGTILKDRDVPHRIMNMESQIAEQVLLKGITQGIPLLPVHDSFICQEASGADVVDMMNEAFQDVFPYAQGNARLKPKIPWEQPKKIASKTVTDSGIVLYS